MSSITANEYHLTLLSRSRKIGYGLDLSKVGMGQRTGRWYLLLDDLKVVATEKEPGCEYNPNHLALLCSEDII
jgi:peroxiredoxin